MLYQVDTAPGEALRTPGSRRGTPAPLEQNDSDGAATVQRLAAFRQWLRLLLFQLLTLAVQVRFPAAFWFCEHSKGVAEAVGFRKPEPRVTPTCIARVMSGVNGIVCCP